MRTATDLRAMLRRTTGVRKMLVVLVVLVMVAVAALAAGAAADRDHSAKRVSVPGRLSVRVPAGWHLVHGWLSDVTDPAPRLAIASFPARLSPHTCECGFPNVVDSPTMAGSCSSGSTCTTRAASSLACRAGPSASRLRSARGCA
jgi:hypothetical protein